MIDALGNTFWLANARAEKELISKLSGQWEYDRVYEYVHAGARVFVRVSVCVRVCAHKWV